MSTLDEIRERWTRETTDGDTYLGADEDITTLLTEIDRLTALAEPVRYVLGTAGEFDQQPDWGKFTNRMMVLPQEPDPAHVWVVYDWDNGNRAYSIHLTAEDAVRGHTQRGYGRIGKWPLGMDLDEAIKAWEGKA